MSNEEDLGEEVKFRVIDALKGLSPFDRKIIQNSRVSAMSDDFFVDMQKRQGSESEIFGNYVSDPFFGKEYSTPEIFIRKGARVPRLSYANVKNLGDLSFVTPEDALLHESGHVVAALMGKDNPRFNYRELSDDGNELIAEKFAERLSKRLK